MSIALAVFRTEGGHGLLLALCRELYGLGRCRGVAWRQRGVLRGLGWLRIVFLDDFHQRTFETASTAAEGQADIGVS